ncbi:protein kinase-like protein [Leishmania infantum JPCM5]|uniref:Protein kinase-like protein n=2 Tax=Leishmania infantum TaxID=5671 RepID=A4I6V7_LEIIN|nr:protein kinase-like protein [Leishmania infantum JPCM5]CAC9519846.1 protein_kinase_-_putative [Leishmania infantum]CAM70534.1 protein kinase-like protein [Leishmania infantum JPCM5]SUZ44407.1 protein_kinase_-_putative [Leishmania infantum]|eukprot:XP_001467476.1 protein kinase-like protein [Leishmania infantum JPCM5]
METPLHATLHTEAWASCSKEPRAETLPRLYANKQNVPRASKRAAWLDFLCRVDILWSILFFALLATVGICSAVVTQTIVSAAVLESWRTLHHVHANIIRKRLDQQISAVYNMAADLILLQARYPFQMQSEDTLATLCSILSGYDKDMLLAALSLVSHELRETITCMHGLTDDALTDILFGYVSYNHTVNATNYVDKDTYRFQRPLRMAMEWPPQVRNISNFIDENMNAVPIFALVNELAAGRNPDIDIRNAWRVNPILPHLMELNVPVGMVYGSPTMPVTTPITDYALLHINGSRLLREPDGTHHIGARIALFVNQTLTDADPAIMSNNWGQHFISSVIHTPLVNTSVTYLKASDVRDPLMRAALQHVDLAQLQSEASRSTVGFQHNGAPAMVTAWTYTTSKGLCLPLVYASVQENITVPHTLIRDMGNGIMVAAVLIFTLIFWRLIHRTISQPLNGVQASMLASVEHGDRQLYYLRDSKLVRFTEVDALIKAHNKTMQQLRDVDAFIPEGLRLRVTDGSAHQSDDVPTRRFSCLTHNSRPPKLKGPQLSLHLSTVVYISMSATASTTTDPLSSLQRRSLAEEQESGQIRGQRLIAAAEQTAQAANTANSGPFPTPAALTAFITAVHELCHTHHGTLHRLCPDACVLHFNSAVRAQLPRGPGDASAAAAPAAAPPAPAARHGVPAAQSAPQPRPPRATRQEEMRLRAAQDARNAAAFALDLVSWTAAQSGSGENAQRDGTAAMPDVRALLDTSMFTCGQYRPAGSEQTLQVALGRDVQRDLGRVPQRIGVRVAMTEETATLLRAEDDSGSRGRGNVDAGVRQIPVDVLRTGRAGLDGDVVVLYEALPGRVAGDAAWQLYARCCCDGFEHMLRGDYAGALAAYRGVAEIADLEPGLLPAAMRREAAASAVTGGAVSVQVARLMRDCERRVRLRITKRLCKVRLCPLGIDAVLRDSKPLGNGTEALYPGVLSPNKEDVGVLRKGRVRDENGSGLSRMSAHRFPRVRERYVLAVKDGASTFRYVVPSMPSWMRDEHGLHWHIARCPMNGELTPEFMWNRRVLALGSAGALCSVNYLIYREVHPVVAKVIRNAPPGPMSDALRSATPVCGPSSRQAAAVRRLIKKHQQLRHPNLLSFLGFSESLEGGVMPLWEFSPGGTLRELIFRYPNVKPVTINRFGLQILTALSYLHERGVAHGSVRLDNVLVSADGKCRLTGHSGDNEAARELFHIHQTCFISPLMATGALPTPQCDMFCIGLGALEALTKQPAWKWATGDDGQPLGTAAELAELMRAGGATFSSALMQGRVVVNADPLRGASVVGKYSNRAVESLIRCLSLDPAERPTAMQVREASKEMLLQAGLTLEEDELAASFPLMVRN